MTEPGGTESTQVGARRFSFSPKMRRALRIFSVWHVFLFAWLAADSFARTDQQRDLVIYYHTAQKALAHQPLYTPRPYYSPNRAPFDYLYPPPFAAVLAPTGGLSWVVWSRAWLALVIVAWWIYPVCLVSLSGARLRPINICLAGALLFTCPNFGAYRAIGLGQADPLLWAAFGLALVGLQSGTKRGRIAAGALLGGATLVKIYSFWSLLALRGRTARSSMWLGAVLALIGGGLLGALVCGVPAYGQWAHVVLPVAGQGSFHPDNVSLSMGVLRLVMWNYTGGPLPPLARAWLSAAALLGPILTLWATRRMPETRRVALVGVAAAWCAPLCWTTYVPLVLAPLALWWRERNGLRP